MTGSGERENSKTQTHVFDASHDLGDPAKHLVIPKSQNMYAESPEGLVALRVAYRGCFIRMNATIDFDRQPNLRTVQIDDERADSMLSPEFERQHPQR